MELNENENKYFDLLVNLFVDDKSDSEFLEAMRTFARFINSISVPIHFTVYKPNIEIEEEMDVPSYTARAVDSHTMMEVQVPVIFRSAFANIVLHYASDHCLIRINDDTIIKHKTQGQYNLQKISCSTSRIIVLHRKMEAGLWSTSDSDLRLEFQERVGHDIIPYKMFLPIVREHNL